MIVGSIAKDEAWRLSATEALSRIRGGSLTSEALLRSCLERIAQREPQLRARTHVAAQATLKDAKEIDKGARKGGLTGLPIGVKDMIDVADMPNTHNSPIYQNNVPSLDAASVAIARAEGALVLGKTDTLEFAAAGRRAVTVNPYNGEFSPGGSSSGSAAAVADGMVPLAIGTQTGGSTIRPASFCGAYALKPTHGLISRDGAKQYSQTLDTIGWYSRTVADLAMMADVYHFPDMSPPDITKPLRIAVCQTPYWDKAEESTRATLQLAASRLSDAGHDVVELALPGDFDGINAAHRTVMIGEGRMSFLPEYLSKHELLHQDFRDRVENSTGITSQGLLDAYDLGGALRPQFDRIVSGFDALLAPAAPGEAPKGYLNNGEATFNALWTMLHAPCIAIPCTTGPQGLPIGVQIIGPRLGDRRLLAVAERVSAAVDRLARPKSWNS